MVFCRINASHKYFFNQRQIRHIHIQHNQAHFMFLTTIAYDKSVIPYGEYFVLLGGETNDTQGGKKHGGRRNATEKQQVMLTWRNASGRRPVCR